MRHVVGVFIVVGAIAVGGQILNVAAQAPAARPGGPAPATRSAAMEHAAALGVDPSTIQKLRLLPSADLGTPDATARILSTAGFVDVVGVKLGMSPQEAQAALKASNPAYRMTAGRLTGYPEARDAATAPVVALHVSTADLMEEVNIGFTLPPGKSGVTAISRQVSFGIGKGPTLANVLAGLRMKYGQELVGNPAAGQFLWAFDSKGQAVKKLPSNCTLDDLNATPAEGTFQDSARMVLMTGTQSGVPIGWLREGLPECIPFTYVSVMMPVNALYPGLATTLRVMVQNKLLDQSAWVEYISYVENWNKANSDKSQRDAGARPVPKL